MKKKKGFTLVELLAVIVILAVILIIAVPRISEVINNSKKASFEATAKLIASQAEKKYTENQVLDGSSTIKCSDVAKISNADYESCNITFDDKGNALVSINGSGKFAGLTIKNATKNSATATELTATDSKYFSYELLADGLTGDKSKIYDVTVADQSKCVAYIKNMGAAEEVATTACSGGVINGSVLADEVKNDGIPASDYETAGLKVDIYNKSVDVTVADQSKCVAYIKNMGAAEEQAITACSGGVINGSVLADVVKNDEIPASDYDLAGLNVKYVYKWYDTNEVTVADQSKCASYFQTMGETEEHATTACSGGVINGLTLADLVKNDEIPASHYEAAGLKVTSKVYDKFELSITGYNPLGGLDVVIPSYIDGYKVTTIASNAFESKGLKSVVIPNTVKTIGADAFRKNKLTNVTIPSSVTLIGNSAFANNKLTNVEIPSSITRIGDYAFAGNPNIVITNNSSIENTVGVWENIVDTSVFINGNVIKIDDDK